MMWNYGTCAGFGGLSSIISLLVTILIAVIIVKLILKVVGKGQGQFNNWSSWPNSAENLLKERFVKGEINKDEYEEKLKILRS